MISPTRPVKLNPGVKIKLPAERRTFYKPPLSIRYSQPSLDDKELLSLLRVLVTALANGWNHLAELTFEAIKSHITEDERSDTAAQSSSYLPLVGEDSG